MKVGDSVKILDGSKIKGYIGNWIAPMEETVGDIDTIHRIDRDGGIHLYNHKWRYDERGLELVRSQADWDIPCTKSTKVCIEAVEVALWSCANSCVMTLEIDDALKMAECTEKLTKALKDLKQIESEEY